MVRFPDEVLARLKGEVSVARLVEGCGVELKRQGKDLIGCCPFHDDSSPSLVVSPGKKWWHCLGACQAGGGPVDWVMAAQGVSFRHAVELLLAESPSLSVLAQSSPLSQGPGPVVKSLTRKLPLLAEPDVSDAGLAAAVVDHYAQALVASSEALGYLGSRGVGHPEAIEMFRFGVFPKKWRHVFMPRVRGCVDILARIRGVSNSLVLSVSGSGCSTSRSTRRWPFALLSGPATAGCG